MFPGTCARELVPGYSKFNDLFLLNAYRYDRHDVGM